MLIGHYKNSRLKKKKKNGIRNFIHSKPANNWKLSEYIGIICKSNIDIRLIYVLLF